MHRCIRVALWAAFCLAVTFLAVMGAVQLFSNSPDTRQVDVNQRDPAVTQEVHAFLGRWRSRGFGDTPNYRYDVPHHFFALSGSKLIWYRLLRDEGTVRLDPTSQPKKLDWISSSNHTVRRGVYQLNEDHLQICFPANESETRRPTTVGFDRRKYDYYDLERGKDEPVEYYEKKLLDGTYQWWGPQSSGAIIPTSQAARALVYMGDAAVPALFRAIENHSIDVGDAWLALQEIGLPIGLFADDLENRDTAAIKKWWAENQKGTIVERSRQRVEEGLPPVLGAE